MVMRTGRAYGRTMVFGHTCAALLAGAGLLPAVCAAVADSSPAPAAPAAMDEIVVVATKRENRIRDVAADVSVITRAELDATLATSLADALRYLPGISHQGAGTRFGNEGVTIRGIGGNRIALEIDGVPLSQHFSVGSFSNATRDFIDPALVGQIEILRGPASALYGSSALGGVVAVRTPAPGRLAATGDIGGDASVVRHGIDDSNHLSARLAVSGNAMSGLLAGSLREGGAAQTRADAAVADGRDFERRAMLARLDGENRYGHRWHLILLGQRDAVVSDIRSVLGNGRFRTTTRLAGDDEMAFDLASADYTFGNSLPWLDEALVRAFLASANIEQHTLDERAAAAEPVLIHRTFHYGQRLRGVEVNLWKQATTGAWSHRFGFGAEWTERKTSELRDGVSESLADGSTTSTILGEDFPLRDFPVTVTREVGAWLSDAMTHGPLTLTAALRYDDNRLDPRPDSVWRESSPSTEPVSISASDLSPKLGAVYRLNANTDVYVQYARGFRAPPFEDANIGLDIPLFNIRAIPNPELESETSDGWELGLRRETVRTRLALSAFHTDYDNFIETKARIGIDPSSGRLLFQSRNIDDARIRGMELRGSVDLAGYLEGVTLTAAAYWAEGEDSTSGRPLGDVGPPQAVMGAEWLSADERTTVRALLTATDDWSQRDDAGEELFEPPGYAVVDLYLMQRFGRHATLRAGIGNLTDRLYWRWSDVRGLAPDDPVLPVLAQPGRHYSIGLEWDW